MYVFILMRNGPKTGLVARKPGYPSPIRFQTRHQLALEMLAESGAALPHTWITGDDEMGRPSGFRQELRALGQRYLLAVPSNTTIRDLRGTGAGVLRTRAPAEVSVRPRGHMVRGFAGGRLDQDRGA